MKTASPALTATQQAIYADVAYRIKNENVKITAWDEAAQKDLPVFQSIGNLSGLHGFANELRREKYEKSGARAEAKLLKLIAAGHPIKVWYYQNVTRDRGAWTVVKTYKTV